MPAVLLQLPWAVLSDTMLTSQKPTRAMAARMTPPQSTEYARAMQQAALVSVSIACVAFRACNSYRNPVSSLDFGSFRFLFSVPGT